MKAKKRFHVGVEEFLWNLPVLYFVPFIILCITRNSFIYSYLEVWYFGYWFIIGILRKRI